jgi:hypothetical protein
LNDICYRPYPMANVLETLLFIQDDLPTDVLSADREISKRLKKNVLIDIQRYYRALGKNDTIIIK